MVCPWCFLGKRRLEAALADYPGRRRQRGAPAFQLDPDAVTEGRSTVDMLAGAVPHQRRTGGGHDVRT